ATTSAWIRTISGIRIGGSVAYRSTTTTAGIRTGSAVAVRIATVAIANSVTWITVGGTRAITATIANRITWIAVSQPGSIVVTIANGIMRQVLAHDAKTAVEISAMLGE
ncbi:MAG: hypothetical protein COB59_07830, partial [Rhodospirillaceae bacterium]